MEICLEPLIIFYLSTFLKSLNSIFSFLKLFFFRFVSIQQSYERLSQIKKRRKSRNTVSQGASEDRTEF